MPSCVALVSDVVLTVNVPVAALIPTGVTFTVVEGLVNVRLVNVAFAERLVRLNTGAPTLVMLGAVVVVCRETRFDAMRPAPALVVIALMFLSSRVPFLVAFTALIAVPATLVRVTVSRS